jgi:CheY-like chemotaxis protein
MGRVGRIRIGEGSRWRVLVVDDEEEVRRLAAECVRLALGDNCEVVSAASGEEAMSVAARKRPDLVLLDVTMPGLDGFEVCRRLKSSLETSNVPVVFLTARGERQAVEAGLALGGDGYVVKPFNAVTLAAQIAELITDPERERD